MPRAARLVVPEVALHLVQRGHNRMPCFFRPGDYADYLAYLGRFALQFSCSIHAYCLMTNHVHLLLTPHHRDACARMMKQVNQCYAQAVNKAARRSGSLWSGRFRSCLVPSETYALTCYRYIELNPVRAGMVPHPRDYRWSSYRANAEGYGAPMLEGHAAYLRLGEAAESRRNAYLNLLDVSLEESAVEEIRRATAGGHLLGAPRRPRGRPRRHGAAAPD
jgi:putative transposase